MDSKTPKLQKSSRSSKSREILEILKIGISTNLALWYWTVSLAWNSFSCVFPLLWLRRVWLSIYWFQYFGLQFILKSVRDSSLYEGGRWEDLWKYCEFFDFLVKTNILYILHLPFGDGRIFFQKPSYCEVRKFGNTLQKLLSALSGEFTTLEVSS